MIFLFIKYYIYIKTLLKVYYIIDNILFYCQNKIGDIDENNFIMYDS